MAPSRLLPIGAAVALAAAAAAAPPAARGPAGMAAAGAPVVVGMAADRPPDPFPLARLRVTDEQFADAAKTFAPGPLVRLPRAAFEEKVRAAGDAARAARLVPRLVEAKYAAAAGAALAGTAEWTVAHPGRGPAVLPLGPLTLALRDPAWADGSPAAVGAFAELPGGVGVWVPGPGRHVLRAKWTAAGTGPAADRAFDLRFPLCPATALDLDAPADRTPAAGADVLVSGPLPGAAAGLRRWRLRPGEKGRIDLAVRGPAAADAGPVVFAAAARYDLAPGETACTFDFDLRAGRGAAEWAFALSPGLRVTDVTANNRAGWAVDPAGKELRVTLRQPAAAAKVRVTAAAPLPAGPGAALPLPTVRPVNGLPAEERAELHLAPGLDLLAWDAGDYRLADAATGPDGGRVLALVGTLLPAESTAPARRPPGLRAGEGGPVFSTTEAVAWRLGGGRAHLAARVGVKVRRGPLFRLAVRPPPGFDLDRAAAAPAELFGFAGPGPAGTAVVEFGRPLAAGQEVEVTVLFRGPPTPAGPVARVPFPAVEILAAAERDGTVTLAPGPGWEAFPQVLPGVADDEAADPAAVRYRGREPAGELALAAVRPLFAAAVEPGPDRAVVRVDVSAGLVGGLAVFEPGPADAGRTWTVPDGSNTVAAAAPARLGHLPAALALFGRPGGFGAVVATAAAGREEPGTLWLVRFARPVESRVTLETTGPGDAARLVVRGATTRTAAPPATPAPEPAGPPGWVVRDTTLSTACVEHDQVATIRGVVAGRGGHALPVALPAGAAARSAAVGGAAVDPASLAGTTVHLPVPAGDGPVAFEVNYRLPRRPRGAAWAVTSPAPEVPGAAGGPRREWVFGPGVSAAWPFAVRAEPGDGGDRSDTPAETVLLVPDRLLTAAGVGLAGLAAGFGWVAARRKNRSAGFALLTVVAGAGAAVFAGPPAWGRVGWPVLAAALPAAAAVAVARGRVPRPAAGAAVLLAAAVGTAQPAGPDVVLVVAAAGGEAVYAPPPLLARLDTLAKPVPPAPVVVGASYDGRAEDGLARVTAAFVVQAFGPGEQAVTLPLADVRLERVAVNGRPAAPAAAGPGRYAVPLPGPGRHAVEVRFAVPVATTGGDREAAFGVPAVPDARLTFAAPPAARQLQAAGRFGEQTTPDPTRIAADLGAVATVTLRWREGPGGAAALSAREGCVWDVTEAGAVLTACYDIRAESGTAAGFRFDLPPGLDPVRVAARGLDPAAGPVAVQGWAAPGDPAGPRTLRVDLAAPADGRVLVTLECHPRAAPTRRPVLRFPRPAGMTSRGGVYGLRAAGVAVDAVGRAGVIDYAADVLVREFGPVPELRLAAGAGLQAFSPQGGDPAELRPVLRVGPPPGPARVDATWAADLRGAVGAGTVAWPADPPAALAEFALAARVREVRGADVLGWAQAGERVQVWFRRPVAGPTVEWVADRPHAPDGNAADAVPFEPPLPRPAGAAAGDTVVRVRPAAGVGVAVDRDTGWAADSPGDDREWAFRGPGGGPPPRLRLAATRSGPAAGFALLDLSGREPAERVAVELPAAAGRPAHAVVRVAGLPPGATADLDPPAGARVSPAGPAAWHLDVPAGGPVRAAVAVRLPAGWAGPLPAVWAGPGGGVPAPGGVVRFVGRVGRADTRLAGPTPATATEQADAAALFPGEVERLRRTGGELLAGGAAELVPPPPVAPAAPPRPAVVPVAALGPTAAGPPAGAAESAGWVLAVLAVGGLFARLPRATWPEQAAALAGLFGHAVAGVPGVGLAAWAAARGVWAADRLRGRAA